MRRMSGITLAYTIMVFPPELDFKTWIQVVPDLMHWIEYGKLVNQYKVPGARFDVSQYPATYFRFTRKSLQERRSILCP